MPDLSDATVHRITAQVNPLKQSGDIVIASIHWGGNWGYAIPEEQRRFAHALIDTAGVDLIHGHSSHHVKGMEVYRGRPILYGCGDFLNDYEGIGGHAQYRGDLGLMYFPRLNPASGRLVDFQLHATRIKNLRVMRASAEETQWLLQVLNREGEALGTRVTSLGDGRLRLHWRAERQD
jgi:poly-gamma-glutamate synthesis protein (capsule biosynthesis protein)